MEQNELIITSPGKFEGEARYVPFYWDRALDGCANEDDGSVYRFYITKEDEILFSELKDGQVLELREDGNGFVHGTLKNGIGILSDDDRKHIIAMKQARKCKIVSSLLYKYFIGHNFEALGIVRALEEAYDAGVEASEVDE